jgi:hypothetical protein
MKRNLNLNFFKMFLLNYLYIKSQSVLKSPLNIIEQCEFTNVIFNAYLPNECYKAENQLGLSFFIREDLQFHPIHVENVVK